MNDTLIGQYTQLKEDLKNAVLPSDIIVWGSYKTLIKLGYKEEDIMYDEDTKCLCVIKEK